MAGQPLADDVPQQGAVLTAELVEAKMAGDLMAARRLEDERYAYFAEASIVFLDLPDAVFRGYEGDEQLLAAPRADDRAPVDLLVKEIARLEPQKVYLPAGRGRPRRPPAGARGGRRPPGAGPPLGDARARSTPASSPTTRTSRTRGGTTSGGSRTSPRAPSPGCPRTSG